MTASPQLTPTQVRAFWEKVQTRESGCWEWTGATTPQGYGTTTWRENGRVRGMPAHRMAYWLRHFELQDGSHIDHLCRNRRCVNADHLEQVAPGENNLRSRQCPTCRHWFNPGVAV